MEGSPGTLSWKIRLESSLECSSEKTIFERGIGFFSWDGSWGLLALPEDLCGIHRGFSGSLGGSSGVPLGSLGLLMMLGSPPGP